MQTKNKDKRI